MRPPYLRCSSRPPFPCPPVPAPGSHSLYNAHVSRVGRLRGPERAITLLRRFIPHRTPSPRREEHRVHGQEAFGTPAPVHTDSIRTSPRRVVLAHPALWRPGSEPRASERVVRRHDAVPRRPLPNPG